MLLTRNLWWQEWKNKFLGGGRAVRFCAHVCVVLDLGNGRFTCNLIRRSQIEGPVRRAARWEIRHQKRQELWVSTRERQAFRISPWRTPALFCPPHRFCDWTCLNSVMKQIKYSVKYVAKFLVWSNESINQLFSTKPIWISLKKNKGPLPPKRILIW